MGYNVLDSLYYRIKATAGMCTPTVEQLDVYLEKAKQYTERAQVTSKFIAVSPSVPEQLRKANESIDGVLKSFDTIDKRVHDLGAACEISDALSALNAWAASPNPDNARAAAAFDKLFGALSVYVAKLPFPANQYAGLLKQISISQFFTNMERLGESRVGGNTSTPTGAQMKAVLDELDRQGSGGR
jgi:hypothetical protein